MIGREEYLTLPDNDLKMIYKRLHRIRRWFTATPMLVTAFLAVLTAVTGFYYLTGYGTYNQSALFGDPWPFVAAMLYYVMAFVHCMFMFGDDADRMKKNAAIFVLLHIAALYVLYQYTGIGILQIVLSLYLSVVGFVNVPIIKEINYMRSLPSYPFNDTRRQEYGENALFRAQMAKHLELTSKMDKDGCVSVGCEDIFDGEIEKHFPKEPEKEEFLQQYKMLYNRDKNK